MLAWNNNGLKNDDDDDDDDDEINKYLILFILCKFSITTSVCKYVN